MIPLLLILFAFGSSNCQVLETRLGSIEASEHISRNGRPYLSYSRIPYGKAPVGQLRFAAPQPHGPWEEMIPAGLPVPMCPQRFFFAPPGLGFMGQEDCLFLTINKPKTDAKNLPVVVYVHGGAFVMGEGGPPSSARYLMDQDIIFITLNYRLGALGFLGLNDTKFSGNYGLKDQILAINWIYENIVDYGGNPDQIYPIGESAGGVFAHLLLLTPGSRDQIAGSIALSGSDSKTCSSVPPRRLKFYAEQVALKLGCDRDSVEEILACFRDVEDHFAFIRVASELSPCIVSSPIFTPTIEPPSPEAVITGKLKPSKKPIIASFAAGEYLLPLDLMGIPGPGELRIAQMKEDFFGYNRLLLEHRVPDDKLDTATQKLIKRYFKQKTNSPDEWLLDNAMIFQDYCFVYPALDLADRHEGPVWLYQLVHRGEVSLSDLKKKSDSKIACHADDKLIYFNMRERFPFATPKERDEDVRVSEELIGYLMNFMKFGEPAPEGKPVKWEPFRKSGQILRVFTNGSEAADKKFLKDHREILKFWRELIEYDHSPKDEL